MSDDTTAAPGKSMPLIARIVAIFALPIFFLLTFTLSYVSALHNPTPHDLALTVAGPSRVTQQIAEEIDAKAKSGFVITQTSSLVDAQHRVESRDAVGAILIEGTRVTTIVATGGGAIATGVVKSVGDQVAAGLHASNSVKDVAPATTGDLSASTLFFLLTACTVGAFLAIVGISQAIARPRMRMMLATNAVAAVVVPVLAYASLSVFVGDYDTTFGDISAVLGIAMLYCFTVGLFTTMLTRLVGVGAIFVVIVFFVGLNFPSTGGSVPESMLPPFWQVIHNLWIGSGALESMRGIVYFGGAQVGHWMVQLLTWFAVTVVLTTVVGVVTRVRSRHGHQPPATDGPLSQVVEASAEAGAMAAVP